MWPDIVNGAFELLGTPFILMSVFKIFKDKKVRGINWKHPVYFTAWGFWNLFYYPHLNQWWSFAGGCGIVVTNFIWVSAMGYYIWKEKK